MDSTELKDHSDAFFRLVNNRFKFRLFLVTKLPAAFISGLRLEEADPDHCTVSIPYKWLTQNPFRSMYFASMSMAAELTTGVLGIAQIWKRKPGVSMLITGMEAKFIRKATSRIFLTCNDGLALKNGVLQALEGFPNAVTAHSVAKDSTGEVVAEFFFTWSFKARNH